MSNPNLPGNPYAGHVLQLSRDTAALRAALLAVAYELRTANLIAVEDSLDRDPRPRVRARLGHDDQTN